MSFAVAPVATPHRARAFTALVIAAALGAATAGAVALAHGAARDQTTTLAAVTLLAALSFVGSGLVAWRRRPEVLTGPLMVAAGFCMFASSLANFDSAVPFTIGLVVAPVGAAFICHLVLSFPDGRLHSGSGHVSGATMRPGRRENRTAGSASRTLVATSSALIAARPRPVAKARGGPTSRRPPA